MKTVQVSGATPRQLDWLVAKCEGLNPNTDPEKPNEYRLRWGFRTGDGFGYMIENYCSSWQHGGPIIERECITVRPVFHPERTENGSDLYTQDGWAAHVEPKAFWITPRPFAGDTPLIAAMRAFVASRMGEEVEIPEELK